MIPAWYVFPDIEHCLSGCAKLVAWHVTGMALIKNKIKFSSYIRKFRVEQLQSHIWIKASSYMGKYFCISSYIRKPFLIYDFATAPLWISLYMRKILFSFLSMHTHLPGRLTCPLCHGRWQFSNQVQCTVPNRGSYIEKPVETQTISNGSLPFGRSALNLIRRTWVRILGRTEPGSLTERGLPVEDRPTVNVSMCP